MWEARAVEGRGPELLDWVRAQRLDPVPLRRETLSGAEDRVLVITWWEPGAEPVELPDPDPDLLHRPVHRWRFTSLGTED